MSRAKCVVGQMGLAIRTIWSAKVAFSATDIHLVAQLSSFWSNDSKTLMWNKRMMVQMVHGRARMLRSCEGLQWHFTIRSVYISQHGWNFCSIGATLHPCHSNWTSVSSSLSMNHSFDFFRIMLLQNGFSSAPLPSYLDLCQIISFNHSFVFCSDTVMLL